MTYALKNGKSLTMRKPIIQDAQAIISIISTVDMESLFLGRNPGEFCTTVEREEVIIKGVLADEDSAWFVAEYEGRLVGNPLWGLCGGLKDTGTEPRQLLQGDFYLIIALQRIQLSECYINWKDLRLVRSGGQAKHFAFPCRQ